MFLQYITLYVDHEGQQKAVKENVSNTFSELSQVSVKKAPFQMFKSKAHIMLAMHVFLQFCQSPLSSPFHNGCIRLVH